MALEFSSYVGRWCDGVFIEGVSFDVDVSALEPGKRLVLLPVMIEVGEVRRCEKCLPTPSDAPEIADTVADPVTSDSEFYGGGAHARQ